MRKAILLNTTATILSVLATMAAPAEWVPQRRTERGVARPEGPAQAEWRQSLGLATEYVYGLPFDADLWSVPERMPQAEESRFLPELYRALWGHESEADFARSERQRFPKEYHDAIPTEGDPICFAGNRRCWLRGEPLFWVHWFN